MKQPTHPVYIVSKGRPGGLGRTANRLIKDGCDFHIVCEPQDATAYRESWGDRVLVLPFSDLGLGSIPARNWIWEHSISVGAKRHWILDDNMSRFYARKRSFRVPCNAALCLSLAEAFVDQYENISVAGLNYISFLVDKEKHPPFLLNARVYSALLIQNDISERWRGRYNEDTDLCLQVIAGGACTVLFNALAVEKSGTGRMVGGNATELYKGDGRLKMARALERQWPGVVRVDRRWGRPQHVIDWRRFDTKLRKRKGAVPNVPKTQVVARKPVRSKLVQTFVERESFEK